MRIKIIVAMSFIALLLAIANVWVYGADDSAIPTISIPADVITYTEGSDQAVLLEGVTANDSKDGDLTDNVRIYDISVMNSGDKAVVTYAVYDNNNNLAKATRVVNYTSSNGKAHVKKEEVTTEEKTTEESTTKASATEAIPEGYEDPVMESNGSPVIKLSTHEVKIQVGEEFVPQEYIEDAVDDVDDRDYLIYYTYVDGYYTTLKKGEYELTYYSIDSNENVSNFAKLKLIVE